MQGTDIKRKGKGTWIERKLIDSGLVPDDIQLKSLLISHKSSFQLIAYQFYFSHYKAGGHLLVDVACALVDFLVQA